MKTKDPRRTAWLRSPKHCEFVVTYAKLRPSKQNPSEDLWIMSWERRGQVLYPRISYFGSLEKPAHKLSDRELGKLMRSMMDELVFLREHPEFDLSANRKSKLVKPKTGKPSLSRAKTSNR